MDDTKPIDATQFRHLTHEMNNSLAYVVTNLNLIAEELDTDALRTNPRLNALVSDALEGSERIGELLRALRRASWGVESSNNAVDAGTPEPAPGEPRGRILVVDDEEAILAAVRRALRAHEVVVASDAEQAWSLIEAAKNTPFDLILCDLIMNGASGIDLYRRLADKHPAVAEHVVFMTAGGFTPEARNFLGNVSNGVLHKPFDVKTLRWVVTSKLREHRAGA
jgi:CheY-like chemotaxis protein